MQALLPLVAAVAVTLWATWPPRGDERGWLALGLGINWAALALVAWQRGVLPGYLPWLLALTLIGALALLLVIWSLTNVLARRQPRGEREH